MYNAGKAKKFLHSKVLEKIVDEKIEFKGKNVVPIGIINTDFDILSDWENSEYKGVVFDSIQKKYNQIIGNEPFYTLQSVYLSNL